MSLIPPDTRNARQRMSYKHLCSLYRPVKTINPATGKPAADTFVLAYAGVHLMYQYTDNVSDPTQDVGRTKRMTIFTTDILHFTADQEIDEGWIIKNTSILPNGFNATLYGQFHRCLGVARVIDDAGARRANKRSMMAMVMEKVPPGVV